MGGRCNCVRRSFGMVSVGWCHCFVYHGVEARQYIRVYVEFIHYFDRFDCDGDDCWLDDSPAGGRGYFTDQYLHTNMGFDDTFPAFADTLHIPLPHAADLNTNGDHTTHFYSNSYRYPSADSRWRGSMRR